MFPKPPKWCTTGPRPSKRERAGPSRAAQGSQTPEAPQPLERRPQPHSSDGLESPRRTAGPAISSPAPAPNGAERKRRSSSLFGRGSAEQRTPRASRASPGETSNSCYGKLGEWLPGKAKAARAPAVPESPPRLLAKLQRVERLNPSTDTPFGQYAAAVTSLMRKNVQPGRETTEMDIENLGAIIDVENQRNPGLNLRQYEKDDDFIRDLGEARSGSFRAIFPLTSRQTGEPSLHHVMADVRVPEDGRPSVIITESSLIAGRGQFRKHAYLREKMTKAGLDVSRMATIEVGAQYSLHDCVMYSLNYALKSHKNSELFKRLHANLRETGALVPDQGPVGDTSLLGFAFRRDFLFAKWGATATGKDTLCVDFYKHVGSLTHANKLEANPATNMSGRTNSPSRLEPETLTQRVGALRVTRKGEGLPEEEPKTYSASIEGFRLQEVARVLEAARGEPVQLSKAATAAYPGGRPAAEGVAPSGTGSSPPRRSGGEIYPEAPSVHEPAQEPLPEGAPGGTERPRPTDFLQEAPLDHGPDQEALPERATREIDPSGRPRKAPAHLFREEDDADNAERARLRDEALSAIVSSSPMPMTAEQIGVLKEASESFSRALLSAIDDRDDPLRALASWTHLNEEAADAIDKLRSICAPRHLDANETQSFFRQALEVGLAGRNPSALYAALSDRETFALMSALSSLRLDDSQHNGAIFQAWMEARDLCGRKAGIDMAAAMSNLHAELHELELSVPVKTMFTAVRAQALPPERQMALESLLIRQPRMPNALVVSKLGEEDLGCVQRCASQLCQLGSATRLRNPKAALAAITSLNQTLTRIGMRHASEATLQNDSEEREYIDLVLQLAVLEMSPKDARAFARSLRSRSVTGMLEALQAKRDSLGSAEKTMVDRFSRLAELAGDRGEVNVDAFQVRARRVVAEGSL